MAIRAKSPTTFGGRGAPITPGAGDLPSVAKAIVCTAAGNVTIVPVDNEDAMTISFTGCPVGFVPPYVVRRVTAATGSWAAIYD